MTSQQEREINSVREAQSRERDKFDNVLFIVAAGALSLSATFITQKSVEFIKFGWLVLSWASFVISLLFLFLSFCSSIKHLREAEKCLRSWKYNFASDAESSCWFRLTDWFNFLILASVILGVIFLVIFGYLNIASLNEVNF